MPAGERQARARKSLEAVGLKGWETHTPGELSGGFEALSFQDQLAESDGTVTSNLISLYKALAGDGHP